MKARVLVVDDDRTSREVVSGALTVSGYSVLTCEDGQEAIQALEDIPVDVLITDIDMPRVDGLQLIDWVRQNKPEIAIVVMTGFGAPALRQACVVRGAIIYLEKPVNTQLLTNLLEERVNKEGFSGVLHHVELLDFLQLVLLTRLDTVVELVSKTAEKATLYIEKGEIVHAMCADMDGEEALNHCLSFDQGNFSTKPWHPPLERTIETPTHFLLMEAARLRDEEGESESDDIDIPLAE